MNLAILWQIFQGIGSAVGILITLGTFVTIVTKKPKEFVKKMLRDECTSVTQNIVDTLREGQEKIIKRIDESDKTDIVTLRHDITSIYYKYKDTILPFYADHGRKVTILFSVENFPGILSQIINIISSYRANILTINQNIPINGLADISISFDTGSILGSVEDIISDIGKITGVRNCSILSRE